MGSHLDSYDCQGTAIHRSNESKKGHATKKDVEEGKATAAQKGGTDLADGLVREATALHGKGTVDLAYWLEARHRAHVSKMNTIQKFIIHMLAADKEEEGPQAERGEPF